MKKLLSLALAGSLLLGSSGCIYVHVAGDFDELLRELDEDGDSFPDLIDELEGCLEDPQYDLDLHANLWRTEAEWTVRYARAGSDEHAAFSRAKEAILERVEDRGGALTAQVENGPHAWECSFQLDDGKGEASVRLVESSSDDGRGSLEVRWKEPN